MIDKCIDSSYNHSHQKSAKSFAKLLDIRPHVGQNSQLHSFTASQLHSFTASQLHSFTASQLHSFTASQLHSFTASQLHSFTASQLRVSCAQIKLHTQQYKSSQPIIRTERDYRFCAFFIACLTGLGLIQSKKQNTPKP
ncbi:hypothetical protein [Treponema sp. B152]|uniref:hypothetical protein n=1 Tax=Treponema sp. B152 TaxID=2749432 RepID=UPI0020A29AB2|nr:hypothetical protein [Treponema sp. B152]